MKNIKTLILQGLINRHSFEFDFAEKWAESIGQALHYSYMTGKKAKVILILEKPEKQMCYFERVQKLGKIYDIDVEYVTPDILSLENNKCRYPDCRCHRAHKKHKFLHKLFINNNGLLRNFVKYPYSV